jgi:peptidoglycan lytic transglycosylase D
MPNETRNYLPKLQAIKNMISNPNMLGFELQTIPNQPYFAVLAAPGHIDVVKAAQLAGMSVEEFRALNAGYEGPLLIQGAARRIVLPFDKVDEFHANLENNNDPLVSWEPHTMKPGETLQKLASKFATTVPRLRRVNHFHRRDHVQPGEIVLVPLGSEDGMTEPLLLHNSAQCHPFRGKQRAVQSSRARSAIGSCSIARPYHFIEHTKALNPYKVKHRHQTATSAGSAP